ncbi:H-NS histone family protein [Rhodobacter capsulatus]|uniref:H-NS histone family protein n=1 Tax=Rhodobacter capsulatus TaxID=1061 RepID=UPI00402981E5
MTIDLRGMSAEDLQKLMSDAKAALDAQEKITKLRAEVIDMIKAEGFTVDDLFPSQRLFEVPAELPVRRGRKPGAASTGGVVSSGSRKPKGEMKYQNPANSAQQWSGAGRKPFWMVEALGKGAALDDLLIKR